MNVSSLLGVASNALLTQPPEELSWPYVESSGPVRNPSGIRLGDIQDCVVSLIHDNKKWADHDGWYRADDEDDPDKDYSTTDTPWKNIAAVPQVGKVDHNLLPANAKEFSNDDGTLDEQGEPNYDGTEDEVGLTKHERVEILQKGKMHFHGHCDIPGVYPQTFEDGQKKFDELKQIEETRQAQEQV